MTGRLTGSRCRCTRCLEAFNSIAAFDEHRVGQYPNERRCLDAATMGAKGMVRNKLGFWITKVRSKHRVKAAPSRIPAVLTGTPIGIPRSSLKVAKSQKSNVGVQRSPV
jgi:hypothetical protein